MQGSFVAVSQSATAYLEFQQNRAFSDKPHWSTGLVSQGLVITAALQASNPEPHTLLGTTVLDALLLGHRAGGPKEKGAGGAGQSRGTLLPAEGVAASP